MPQDMYLSFITKKITEYLKTLLPEKKKKSISNANDLIDCDKSEIENITLLEYVVFSTRILIY